MKEIIILFSYYGIGGAQRRAANIADFLSKNGFKVSIVALLGSNYSITTDNFYNISDDVEIVLLPEWFEKNKNNKEIISVIDSENKAIKKLKTKQNIKSTLHIKDEALSYNIKSAKNSIKLKAFLSLHKNALLVNFGFNVFDISFFGRYSSNKLIYVETNSSEKYKNDRNFDSTLSNIKSADGRIYQTACEMAEQGINADSKSVVIHNPLNGKLIDSYHGERNNVIVNFCALKRQKNLLLLIKGFEKIHTDYPDYFLKIYCLPESAEPDEYATELIDYIDNHGLSASAQLLPMCDNIHDIIKSSAMFVSTSDYEGISNSMIEAMAIGLPTICTDCSGGGAREFVQNEHNGLLIPVGDENALYEAIKKFIENKELTDSCSKNASLIRNELQSDIIYNQWFTFLRNYI